MHFGVSITRNIVSWYFGIFFILVVSLAAQGALMMTGSF